jgi:hypothetical protein
LRRRLGNHPAGISKCKPLPPWDDVFSSMIINHDFGYYCFFGCFWASQWEINKNHAKFWI